MDEAPYGYATTQNLAAINAAGLEGVDKVDATVQAALMNLGSNGAYDMQQDKVVSTMSLGDYGSDDLNLTGLSIHESQGLFQSLLSSPFATASTLNQGEGGATWQRDAAAELDTVKSALAGGTKYAYTMVGAGNGGQAQAYGAEATAHAVAALYAVALGSIYALTALPCEVGLGVGGALLGAATAATAVIVVLFGLMVRAGLRALRA